MNTVIRSVIIACAVLLLAAPLAYSTWTVTPYMGPSGGILDTASSIANGWGTNTNYANGEAQMVIFGTSSLWEDLYGNHLTNGSQVFVATDHSDSSRSASCLLYYYDVDYYVYNLAVARVTGPQMTCVQVWSQ